MPFLGSKLIVEANPVHQQGQDGYIPTVRHGLLRVVYCDGHYPTKREALAVARFEALRYYRRYHEKRPGRAG